MSVRLVPVGLLVCMLVSCGRQVPPAAPTGRAVPVESAVVVSEDVDVVLAAVGTLEADQAVDIKPKRGGHIRELHIPEGTQVAAGDVLAILHDADYRARVDQARASIVDAEAKERNARQQFDRVQALLRKGVAAQQQYDDARADLDRAVATIGVARANLAFAEAELADTVVRAPFGGMLGRRLVDAGAYVKDGETIVRLVDADPIEVVFAIPEQHLAQIQVGQPIEVRVTSRPDRAFPGRVGFIDPQVDAVNRTVTVKAVVPNPAYDLRPGQFATVRLQVDRHPNAPVVPEEAVVVDGDRAMVFVVVNGTASARTIRTGIRLPGRVEVVDGLRAGDRIVRRGHEKLKADAAAPVVETSTPAPG